METELGATHVPARTQVFASIHLINRDPATYSEPLRFRPERWKNLQPSPHQYAVFGAGAHMCPGATFGDQMAKIALAAILSRYRVELAPRARVDYYAAITLSPYPALPIILRDKSRPPVSMPFVGRAREFFDLNAAA